MVAAFAALAHAGIWAGDSFGVALAGVWADAYAPALASGGLRAAFPVQTLVALQPDTVPTVHRHTRSNCKMRRWLPLATGAGLGAT